MRTIQQEIDNNAQYLHYLAGWTFMNVASKQAGEKRKSKPINDMNHVLYMRSNKCKYN